MVDLDRSGQAYQIAKVYLGPSLGWVYQQVRPALNITAAGTYPLTAGTSIVLIDVAGVVVITLPDVVKWVNEFMAQPMTGFERAIWVKDIGGHATAFPITVNPFGAQTIDRLASFTIINNRALIRLYPLMDLTGWFVG